MNIASIELYPTDPVRLCQIPADLSLAEGDYVVLSMPEGAEESGRIRQVIEDMDAEALQERGYELSKDVAILRVSTENDCQRIDANTRMIDGALVECEQLIAEHNLGMRLVTAHFSFDGRHVMFIFTAENRVDFRALVKDLARHFKRRVRLKQIGPRDRARHIAELRGAYGRCGRPLCCGSFLGALDSITMDMVRDQNLEHKGAAKLSGVCGKLMSCLSYEVGMYRELKEELPGTGSMVHTEWGDGTVTAIDVLSQMLTITYSDGTTRLIHCKDATLSSAHA